MATLLFIADYQQRENVKEHLDTRDKTAYQIIEYFQKREFRRLSPTYYHLGLRITIPSLLRKQNAKAYLSLYAGSEKMYKVTNTKKFIRGLLRGEGHSSWKAVLLYSGRMCL